MYVSGPRASPVWKCGESGEGVIMGAPGGLGVGRLYEIVGVPTTAAFVGIWPEVQGEAGVILIFSVQGREQAAMKRLKPNIHRCFRNMA